jgi:hypothetical protein
VAMALMTEAVSISETLAEFYQTTRRSKPRKQPSLTQLNIWYRDGRCLEISMSNYFKDNILHLHTYKLIRKATITVHFDQQRQERVQVSTH